MRAPFPNSGWFSSLGLILRYTFVALEHKFHLKIDILLLWFDDFQDSLKFMRNNTKEFVTTVNSNLTCSLMRILDCFFAPFVPKEVRTELID